MWPRSFDEALETDSLKPISSCIKIKCTTHASLTPPTKPSTFGSFPAAITYKIKIKSLSNVENYQNNDHYQEIKGNRNIIDHLTISWNSFLKDASKERTEDLSGTALRASDMKAMMSEKRRL